jgi:hydrogenase maturation protease
LKKTLIIGYGNPDRQDDGAAWHALVRLAARLERPLPDGPEEGFFPEELNPDLWFALQLVPEMADTFAQYERILFIDAHTGHVPQEILMQPVYEAAAPSSLTHVLSPAACMALTWSIYARRPQALLLTMRGYSFKFTRELTPETSKLVDQAVEMAWDWLGAEEHA